MSRITPAVSKLVRALGSTPAVARAGNRLDTTVHNAGAVLMPKYAELLRNRRINEQPDSSRGLTTTHRPTPQPSLANRSKPLMQTFSSSAATAATVVSPTSTSTSTSTHLDAIFLPNLNFDVADSSASVLRVPILPDNYGAAPTTTITSSSSSSSLNADGPVSISSAPIVAANPDNVLPATALSEVQSIGFDNIDLNFIYASQPAAHSVQGQRMIKDLWKGL